MLRAEAAFSLAAPPDHLLVVALSHAASNPGRLDLFISEMTEKRVDEGKTVKMAHPLHAAPPWTPSPAEQLPPPPQNPLEQLLSVWLPWPPCQLFDVTHQSSIFPVNL